MAIPRIILLGGGQHAHVVLDCLLSQHADVIALFDIQYQGDLFGIPQRGEYDADFEPTALGIVAIGDNATRKRVAAQSRHAFTNAVHSSVILSKYSEMGIGNMILHGTIIQAQVSIGNHTIINTGTQVDHHCIIEDFAHLAPGVILCGNVQIGEGTLVGAGTTVIPGKKIGAWATIGAGAVVIDDIPDYAVAVGNPARIFKYQKP
ncbi:MAG: acetyltransferase [Marivirga sp.]|nr:acetyltransferase [Marivirga sp.]